MTGLSRRRDRGAPRCAPSRRRSVMACSRWPSESEDTRAYGGAVSYASLILSWSLYVLRHGSLDAQRRTGATAVARGGPRMRRAGEERMSRDWIWRD